MISASKATALRLIVVSQSGALPASAQEIKLQSAKDAGEIKSTGSTDGLNPATITVQPQPGAPRPAVPKTETVRWLQVQSMIFTTIFPSAFRLG